MLFFLLHACGNECSYFEACDGDTLLVCGDGVDQQFGRKVYEVPCEAPNPVCVATSDEHAVCAVGADPCESDAAATCDGDVLLACVHVLQTFAVEDGSLVDDVWLTQGTDCSADGRTCDETAGACVGTRR